MSSPEVLTMRVDSETIARLNRRLDAMREEAGEGAKLSLSDAARVSLFDGLKRWELEHFKRRARR